MKLYKKRPLAVWATQFMGGAENGQLIEEWSKEQVVWNKAVNAMMFESGITCEMGAWVIKGIDGEYYPCADDIFQATYKEVDDTSTTPTTL